MNFQTKQLVKIIKNKTVALFCNHTSYDFDEDDYLFNIIKKYTNLKLIITPEHGLFGELQDQVKLDDTSYYNIKHTKIVSAYSSDENKIFDFSYLLNDIEIVIIDIQDVGVRYYTFANSVFYLMKTISCKKLSAQIAVIDKPNPSGRRVEGTALQSEFTSFLGITGLPHRHGLTIAELILFFADTVDFSNKINIIRNKKFSTNLPIFPSPNFPSVDTAKLYSGTCLFEATTISEGRGTTKPFEIIGAPFLDFGNLEKIKKKTKQDHTNNANFSIRLTKFIPAFHKFAGEICSGFHIKQIKEANSLLFALNLIRNLSEIVQNFWREGTYEAGSDKTALELLAGDKLLIDYLYGKENLKNIIVKLNYEQNLWLKTAEKYLIYNEKIYNIKI